MVDNPSVQGLMVPDVMVHQCYLIINYIFQCLYRPLCINTSMCVHGVHACLSCLFSFCLGYGRSPYGPAGDGKSFGTYGVYFFFFGQHTTTKHEANNFNYVLLEISVMILILNTCRRSWCWHGRGSCTCKIWSV